MMAGRAAFWALTRKGKWGLRSVTGSMGKSMFCAAAASVAREEVSGSGATIAEAKKLLRMANVETLKQRLVLEAHREVITLNELVELCCNSGVASSHQDALEFAKTLDDSAVVLIFRNKVYLHPSKVAELLSKALPLALAAEDDPRKEELEKLKKEKEELDHLAHKHVRRMLWTGLAGVSLQVLLFFRLTFWELSWDVMEPVAFFGTSGGLIVGYTYFLLTHRNPSYRELMNSLFVSRQKKLYKKRNFDINRFLELHKQCQIPSTDKVGLHPSADYIGAEH